MVGVVKYNSNIGSTNGTLPEDLENDFRQYYWLNNDQVRKGKWVIAVYFQYRQVQPGKTSCYQAYYSFCWRCMAHQTKALPAWPCARGKNKEASARAQGTWLSQGGPWGLELLIGLVKEKI